MSIRWNTKIGGEDVIFSTWLLLGCRGGNVPNSSGACKILCSHLSLFYKVLSNSHACDVLCSSPPNIYFFPCDMCSDCSVHRLTKAAQPLTSFQWTGPHNGISRKYLKNVILSITCSNYSSSQTSQVYLMCYRPAVTKSVCLIGLHKAWSGNTESNRPTHSHCGSAASSLCTLWTCSSVRSNIFWVSVWLFATTEDILY